MSFSGSISGWVTSSKRDLDTLLRAVANDAAMMIVERTRVDTGFARGSWYAVIGRTEGRQEGSPDKSGVKTMSSMGAVIRSARWGDIISLANGASYIVYLEYGTSKMAADAMVRGTRAALPSIVDRHARRLGFRR